MPDLEPTHLVEVTAELVTAYVTRNHVKPGELPDLIATVHATLGSLGSSEEPKAVPEKLNPPVSIRKSITDEYLISLEDGRKMKSLKRHLAGLGMTPEAYRTKWGLPYDYPMVAPAYARQRSEMAKSFGLGNIRRKG